MIDSVAGERTLLILGNSVSLPPREAPPDAPVTSYPERLRVQLAPMAWRTETRIVSGATVGDIEKTASAFLPILAPDAVVIQLGIVDCTPRPLRESERIRLSTLRPVVLQNLVISLIHRYRAEIIGRRALIQKTPIEPFTQLFHRLAAHSRSVAEHVVALPIFPATASILRRNPRLAVEIDKYNSAMGMEPGIKMPKTDEVLGGFSPDDICAAPESVHLNQQGHDLVARYVEAWLLRVTTERQRSGAASSETNPR